jgi:hypothetical protein
MNKIACGITALGLMAGSAFADYPIITLDGTGTNNPKTAYDNYIALYGTGKLLPGNEEDEYGYAAFKNGYAVIEAIIKDPAQTGDPDAWDAVALSIKNDNTAPNMKDCSGGFSYQYKGAAHNFELSFDPALCGGTNPDEGSNKWGQKAVAANTTSNFITKTITFANLQTTGLINTWTGDDPSKCQTATAPTLNLEKVLQMSWVVDGGTAAIGKTLTIGTVTCLGGTLPSSSSAAPSSSSVAASSSSGGASSSSSSSGTTNSSSSGTGTSSSSSDDPEPIISYNNTPVLGLNVVHFAHSLQIASGKDATVALFDISGKQVLSQKVLSGTTTINLGNQKQGVYYAVAKSGSQKQIVKIVLK